MELLPVIYNSLIIAAGLFVITIAISYVSYKIKDNRTKEGQTSTTPHKKYLEDDDHSELKPKFKSPPPVKKSKHKSDKPVIEEKKRRVEKPRTPPKSDGQSEKRRTKPEAQNRIEVVKDLSKSSTKETEPQKSKADEKPKSDEKKKKKNLKSIDEDPIRRYTDSADDDLHPLKTEE